MTEPVIVELTESELTGCEALFPAEIESNLWVLYHATSSICEKQIDSEGLLRQPSSYAKSDVENLVSIFESMDWAGVNGGGFVILKPFSLDGDFQSEEVKPIYFREDSLFSPIYATRNFAGGETARAVRHAIADLELYMEDESVRNRYIAYRRQKAMYHGQADDSAVAVNLDWLRDSIANLSELRQRCFAIQEAYRYGVVYAVKFTPEDLESLSYCSSMGVRCFCDLTANRIVGKARLHAGDEVIERVGRDQNMFDRYKQRRDAPNSLLSHIDGGRA